MTVIKNEVREAIDKELSAAVAAHGINHSFAEKYALMLEELEEAEEEIAEARRFLAMMWRQMRFNNDEVTAQHASRVAQAAERAACECIQLAAMGKKDVSV